MHRGIEIDRVVVVFSRCHRVLVFCVIPAVISAAVVLQVGKPVGDELGGSTALHQFLDLRPGRPVACFDLADCFFWHPVSQPCLGEISLESRFSVDGVDQRGGHHHSVFVRVRRGHPEMDLGDAVHRASLRNLKNVGRTGAFRQGKIVAVPQQCSAEIVGSLEIRVAVFLDAGRVHMGNAVRVERFVIREGFRLKFFPAVIGSERAIHVALHGDGLHVFDAVVHTVQVV